MKTTQWNRRFDGARASSLALALLCGGVIACTGASQNKGQTPGNQSSRRVLSVKPISTKPAVAPKKTPSGPFGLVLLNSPDGKPTKISDYEANAACAECHPRQWKEMKGSGHNIAHVDTLYRRTAELAKKEAGDAVYTYCSGCHTPQGVASGLVPKVPEEKLPARVKAGVLCDSCHQISALTGHAGPWAEPGNASFVLSPASDKKYGPPTGKDDDAEHGVEARPFFQKSEFCASCHTVIHAINGVRIEHTYGEWKKSLYAQKGIQCQDCHMRTVEQARKVAATMKPVALMGKSSAEGGQRPIASHFFAGGNASIDKLGGSAGHAKMAEERLKSAARFSVQAPAQAKAGGVLRFEVSVENVGAGHSLPTSLTELRQVWVDLSVKNAGGEEIFRSGQLDEKGDIPRDAMRFGAEAGDQNGKLTYKPWEVTHFIWKRLIPAKETAKDEFSVPLPQGVKGPLKIEAKLLYRSAPPVVVELLFGAQKPALRTTEMARAEASVALH